MTDEEIIKSVINGNTNAFAEIIERYKDRVFSMVYKFTNDEGVAEDMSQEIFLKAFKNISKFRGESKFTTWLYRLSKNYCIDWARKQRNNINFVELEDIPSEDNILDSIISNNNYKCLKNEINDLPEKYKTPLYLYHIKGYSYQEIANTLNIPKRTVETRIYRAKKILKEKLAMRGLI